MDAKERKQLRFKTLTKLFCDKHDGRVPKDKFERYLLRLLIDLGAAYDENQDKRRNIHYQEGEVRKQESMLYKHREKILNQLGHNLRGALCLSSVAKGLYE